MAMVAIGLNTNIKKLIFSGAKPLILGFCCWFAISLVSIGLQKFLEYFNNLYRGNMMDIINLILTLIIAILGGYLADKKKVPAAYMLGALFLVAIFNIFLIRLFT